MYSCADSLFISIIGILSVLYISDTLDTLMMLKLFLVLTYKAGYQNFLDTLSDTLHTLFKDKKKTTYVAS
jgi:hypothetical protein